jgi:hypothetical protein
MYTPPAIDLQAFTLQPGDPFPKLGRPQRQRRPKPTGRFLSGPVSWDWLTAAAKLPGKALHVALVIQFLAGLNKSATLRVSRDELDRFGLKRTTAYRALAALESVCLVSVSRHPGRLPVVTITADHAVKETSEVTL